MNKLNYIDLFAGDGGFSESFIRKGFRPIVLNEMNKAIWVSHHLCKHTMSSLKRISVTFPNTKYN